MSSPAPLALSSRGLSGPAITRASPRSYNTGCVNANQASTVSCRTAGPTARPRAGNTVEFKNLHFCPFNCLALQPFLAVPDPFSLGSGCHHPSGPTLARFLCHLCFPPNPRPPKRLNPPPTAGSEGSPEMSTCISPKRSTSADAPYGGRLTIF